MVEVAEGGSIGVTVPRMVGDDTVAREEAGVEGEVEVEVCVVVRHRLEEVEGIGRLSFFDTSGLRGLGGIGLRLYG